MKTKQILNYLLSIAIVLVITGCSNSSSSTSSSTSYSTVTVAGTVTVDSGISGAMIANGKLLPSASIAQDNYLIWAQNRASNRVYFTELDENGDFSLPVEVADSGDLGSNFMFCIIQKDPLAFLGTIMKSSTENMSSGFKINSNVSNFSVNFDTSKRGAVLSSTPDEITIDTSQEVRVDNNNKPLGADNAGKGLASKTGSLNSNNTIDPDQDGVPNIFDAMNNGTDIDNKNESNKYESSLGSDALKSVIMFMNLKVDEEMEDSYTVTDSAVIVIEAIASDPNDIQSIEADLMHTSFKNSTLDRVPGGFTAIDSGHTENSNWLQGGTYPLYKMQNASGDIVWTVLLKPGNNSFNPGSLVRLKVTLTDSSVEYYFTSINFKFSTIVDHTTSGFLSGDGSRDNPYVVPSTGNVTLNWTAPLDEDGDTLEDLEYSLEFFFYDNSTPENQVGSHQVQEIGDDIYTGIIPAATIDQYDSESPAPSFMQIDITCRYPYGDNSANKIYLKRNDW